MTIFVPSRVKSHTPWDKKFNFGKGHPCLHYFESSFSYRCVGVEMKIFKHYIGPETLTHGSLMSEKKLVGHRNCAFGFSQHV